MRSLFGRKKLPRSIHPGEWPEQTGKPRVLIENPDGADLWAHAEVLREAGYDVATCAGPTAETKRVPWFRRGHLYWADPQPMDRQERTLCPLVAFATSSSVWSSVMDLVVVKYWPVLANEACFVARLTC